MREPAHTPSARMCFFFFSCTVIHAHFYVNYGTRVLFRVFCAIRDDEKESWIIRQGNLGANTQAKPCTVHIGHGVNRSANHLQFISQISSDPIELDCLRNKNFGNKDVGIYKRFHSIVQSTYIEVNLTARLTTTKNNNYGATNRINILTADAILILISLYLDYFYLLKVQSTHALSHLDLFP